MEKTQQEKEDDEYWSECDVEISDLQHSQLLQIISHYSLSHVDKQACRTSSLTGEAYIQELLDTAHPRRCIEVLRMPLATFLALDKWLVSETSLKKSCKGVSTMQKLAMFLQIVGEGSGNRAVQERFQHSGDTVSHVFHEVLAALMILHQKIVLLPHADTPLANRIAKNTKYFPYFENCIGALDGTHFQLTYQQHKQHLIAIAKAVYHKMSWASVIWI